ncbi:MAG: hypothetical protein OQJ84_11785 [Xanthomonadales bacterium]|nr:hypothetical protein [Xanthomonadales bacterium]
MTDKTAFSVDIDINPAPGFKPLPDWVAFDLCKPYPVPGGNLLLHNTRNGKRAMVQPEVYASLVSCNTFQTLETHVGRLIQKQPAMQAQRDDVRGVLQQMLGGGIMRSAKEIVGALGSGPKTAPAAVEKPVVAILTWERPQALDRLLTSVVANCETAALHSLYVIDDSRSTDNIDKNRALVQKHAADFDSPLVYFGKTEQQRYIGQLADLLPKHEDAIRFLIDHQLWTDQWTSGLARNLAVFLSCGRRLVMLDDDVVCDVYTPANAKPNITISDAAREADFFANKQEWAPLHQPLNPDPISRHMQCLGLSLSGAIDVLGNQHLKQASLENTTSLQASELLADSPVLITECGSLGCPGTESNTWLPTMAEASLKRMLASPKRTTQALTTRKVWSGRKNPHFSPRSNMSQITGIDNRQPLPPYLPIARGEDRLFGLMLDFVFPTSVCLDYPWAVPHLPIPEREWDSKHQNFTPKPDFPMFFIDKVLEHRSVCQSVHPADRMAVLATMFRDLARAPNDVLINMQRDKSLADGSDMLNHLDDLLASAGSAPVEWQNYLRNGISQLNKGLEALSRDHFPVKGSVAELEDGELIDFWRGTWAGFADALDAWPEIRQAASKLIETWTPS